MAVLRKKKFAPIRFSSCSTNPFSAFCLTSWSASFGFSCTSLRSIYFSALCPFSPQCSFLWLTNSMQFNWSCRPQSLHHFRSAGLSNSDPNRLHDVKRRSVRLRGLLREGCLLSVFTLDGLRRTYRFGLCAIFPLECRRLISPETPCSASANFRIALKSARARGWKTLISMSPLSLSPLKTFLLLSSFTPYSLLPVTFPFMTPLYFILRSDTCLSFYPKPFVHLFCGANGWNTLG